MGHCFSRDTVPATSNCSPGKILQKKSRISDANSLPSSESHLTEPTEEDLAKPATRGRYVSHDGVLSTVALKFPRIRKSFHTLSAAFKEYAGDRCHMNKTEFLDCVNNYLGIPKEKLVIHPPVEIFEEYKTNEDNIELREFIIGVVCTWVYQDEIGKAVSIQVLRKTISEANKASEMTAVIAEGLQPDPSQQAEMARRWSKISYGFLVVKSAFRAIDVDSNDVIDFEEFKNALNCEMAAQQRIDECDINMSGDVTLSEFVYGFAFWCGADTDDLLSEDFQKP